MARSAYSARRRATVRAVVPRLRARDRKGSPVPLSALIRQVYPGREPDEITAFRVFHKWRHVVTELEFLNARPARLRQGVLYVPTATSAWAFQLEFRKEQLLTALRAETPEARLRGLRFQVGKLPELLPTTRPERVPAPPVVVPPVPESLARALASIDDDEL